MPMASTSISFVASVPAPPALLNSTTGTPAAPVLKNRVLVMRLSRRKAWVWFLTMPDDRPRPRRYSTTTSSMVTRSLRS